MRSVQYSIRQFKKSYFAIIDGHKQRVGFYYESKLYKSKSAARTDVQEFCRHKKLIGQEQN